MLLLARRGVLCIAVWLVGVSGEYCTAGPGITGDSNLGLQQIVGNNIITYAPGCPGVRYVDDQTHRIVNLSIGMTYPNSSFNFSTCSVNYPGAGTVWIDFNRDTIFSPEEVITTWYSIPTKIVSAPIIVPENASPGLTRLRIMHMQTGWLPQNPCEQFTWGAVIDFGINIQGPLPSCNYWTPAGPANGDGSNIRSITLFGNPTLSYPRTCPGVIGIDDRTDLTTSLVRGHTYRMIVDFGTCDLIFAGAGTVWIDLNHDAIFGADEVVAEYRGMPNSLTLSIAIPATAALGPTRMRVMQQEAGVLPLDPCANFGWGSIVDFSLTIEQLRDVD